MIEITIGGFAIPMRNVFELIEITEPNEATNVTLSGERYTDFVNNLRSWTIKFAYLCQEDFDQIYQVYLDQFNNATYPALEVPTYNLDTPVKMNVSNKNIKYDGGMIVDYEVTLLEQFAIS